jgi:hypothetical protein
VQDGPVQTGDQLAQMVQFLQVGLQGYIPAGSLHPNPLDPLDESSAPMAHLLLLRNHHSIKQQHPFDLVFTSRLLPHHALTGPDQGAIFQLRSTRHIDAFDLPIAKTPGQFAAIDWIPFGPSLFILRRDIRRVNHETLDPFLPQLIVDPEAAIPRFISRIIQSAREIMAQVMDQFVGFRRLVKRFILPILRKDTYTPALFVDIQTDINRLTRKIKSATLNITHGKPPFGEFLRRTKNYTRKLETCLSFSIIRSEPWTDEDQARFSISFNAFVLVQIAT